MNRPGPGVRAMGSPSGACAMFAACALVVAGVLVGELPWWLALLAFGFANGTVSAVRQMRTYNAWAADWRMMATGSAAPEAPRKKPRTKRNVVLDVVAGVALMVALPWLSSQAADTTGERQFLAALWLVDAGYLVFLAVRGIARRAKARSAAKAGEVQKPVEDAAVAWLVNRASSSPSRADAMRELPEYSARLLTQSEMRTAAGISSDAHSTR